MMQDNNEAMGALEEQQISATAIAKASKLLPKEQRDLGSWRARQTLVGCYCSYRAYEMRDSYRSNNILVIIIIISIKIYLVLMLLVMLLLLPMILLF